MSRTVERKGLVAVLDVGTSKVSCFIARRQGIHGVRIVGIGHTRAEGLRQGVITDLNAAEMSVRAAVEAAEQMAGERIEGITVALAGGQLASKVVTSEVEPNGPVTEAHVAYLTEQARDRLHGLQADILHGIPLDFIADGTEGVEDPVGMHTAKLRGRVLVVAARPGPLRNLIQVVERCHLNVDAVVAAPYAAALDTLAEDERALGCVLLDMGAGTTSLAVFAGGHLRHVASLPVGGGHVTNDIARGLSTPLANAERLKTLYGSAMAASIDDREVLRCPLIGEEEESIIEVPRSLVVQIIQPRLEETFEMVRHHLEQHGVDRVAGRRVVLTGGASQLEGARDLAALVLDRQVRLARPAGLPGMAESTSGPAFAASSGLLHYALMHTAPEPQTVVTAEPHRGPLGRLGQWFLQNF